MKPQTSLRVTTVPRLLLHVCCAPCATWPHRTVAEQGFTPVLFFFNPNIHPPAEHERRLAEARRYAAEAGLDLLAVEEGFEGWAQAVRGLEAEPEGGARCDACFRHRLDRTARAAAEGGFEAFASTLTVSPHKNAADVARAGEAAAAAHGVAFLPFDFKKKGGFQESVRLSREHGLYRQDYCGCRFSARQRGR